MKIIRSYLFLVFLTLASCHQPIFTCDGEQGDTATSNEKKELYIAGKPVAFNLWEENKPQSSQEDYALMMTEERIPEKQLENFLDIYGFYIFAENFTNNKFDIVQLIFFVPKNSIDQAELDPKNIQGLMVYFSESGKLRARVYAIKSGDLDLIEELNASPPAISSNTYWLGSQLFKKETSQKMASVVLRSTTEIPDLQLYNPFKDDFIGMLEKHLEK